jgi:hypothetical protein
MVSALHVGRIGLGRRGNAHLRIDRLSNVNRSAPMPNLENLRKQAKLILRRHRDRYHPVAAQIRTGLPRYSQLTDSEILAQSNDGDRCLSVQGCLMPAPPSSANNPGTGNPRPQPASAAGRFLRHTSTAPPDCR